MPSCQRSIPQTLDIPEHCILTKFKKVTQSKILTTTAILVVLLEFSNQTFSKSNKNNMGNDTKEKIGVLVTMKAKPGKEQVFRNFLPGGLTLVNQEPGAESWDVFHCVTFLIRRFSHRF